jgi:hypothetical protein
MNEVLEEMATKVMEEKEGPLEMASEVPACDISIEIEEGKDVMEVEENTLETQIEEPGKVSEVSVEANGDGHCTLVAQGRHADAKFVGATLIP